MINLGTYGNRSVMIIIIDGAEFDLVFLKPPSKFQFLPLPDFLE